MHWRRTKLSNTTVGAAVGDPEQSVLQQQQSDWDTVLLQLAGHDYQVVEYAPLPEDSSSSSGEAALLQFLQGLGHTAHPLGCFKPSHASKVLTKPPVASTVSVEGQSTPSGQPGYSYSRVQFADQTDQQALLQDAAKLLKPQRRSILQGSSSPPPPPPPPSDVSPSPSSSPATSPSPSPGP
jgi:hypothetical protein